MNRSTRIALLLLAGSFTFAAAQKKVLGIDDFDRWNQIGAPRISDNGQWIAYELKPAWGEGAALLLYNTQTNQSDTLRRATGATFFGNDQWLACKITPTWEQNRQAKIKKLTGDRAPQDSLLVLSLATGAQTRVPNGGKSLQVAEEGTRYAFLREITPPKDTTDKKAPKPKKFSRLVVVDPARGDSLTVDSVESYKLSKNGRTVLYALKGDSLRGVGMIENGKIHSLYTAKQGKVAALALDEQGGQAAYLLTADTTDTGRFQLFYTRVGKPAPKAIAEQGAPNGFVLTVNSAPSFSKEGSRLEFGMAPKPKEVPKDTLSPDEKFSVDLWSWNDTTLMTQQIATAEQLKKRTYKAVYLPKTGRWELLGDPHMERIVFAEGKGKGLGEEAPYALGMDDSPYEWASSWDNPAGADLYRIDLANGARELLVKRALSRSYLSPSSRYVLYYDPRTTAWWSVETASGTTRNLTEAIPYPLYEADNDLPSDPSPEGFGGWTATDKAIIYDRFDLWLVDPSGKTTPLCLTAGAGRRDSTTLRYVRLTREDPLANPAQPMLLSAFNHATKQGGYCRRSTDGGVQPLLASDHLYTFVAKAEKADRLLWQRENFVDYRDLWTSDLSLDQLRRVSTANPQQSDYRWGSVRRTSYTDMNGIEREGLLYLPEDYDPAKRYPTILYFYERHTDGIHKHVHPQPSWSIVIPAVCTSQEYVVFMPDIHYRIGFPGQSCYDAVMGAAKTLIDRGIADPARMGLQGQSWGGYQIAYLVTRTDLFRCASAGAPVSNMTSAFGGIRWGTGIPRMFQYERGQSRIGGSLWEKPIEYIENSPLFFAPKVRTPILLRHDDADEAVPWYQGIEYFLALRRAGVPVWMLNYNGQPHNLRSYPARRDWDRRMMQFFDHYLKDTPAPRWMREGISITEKGVDQKYDF